jgi:hypothetical protein
MSAPESPQIIEEDHTAHAAHSAEVQASERLVDPLGDYLAAGTELENIRSQSGRLPEEDERVKELTATRQRLMAEIRQTRDRNTKPLEFEAEVEAPSAEIAAEEVDDETPAASAEPEETAPATNDQAETAEIAQRKKGWRRIGEIALWELGEAPALVSSAWQRLTGRRTQQPSEPNVSIGEPVTNLAIEQRSEPQAGRPAELAGLATRFTAAQDEVLAVRRDPHATEADKLRAADKYQRLLLERRLEVEDFARARGASTEAAHEAGMAFQRNKELALHALVARYDRQALHNDDRSGTTQDVLGRRMREYMSRGHKEARDRFEGALDAHLEEIGSRFRGTPEQRQRYLAMIRSDYMQQLDMGYTPPLRRAA